MARPKKKDSILDSSTTTVKLTKAQVLENMVGGLYKEYPELFVPHSIGEEWEEWQKDVIRAIFKFGEKKVTVRAGHGVGMLRRSGRILLTRRMRDCGLRFGLRY